MRVAVVSASYAPARSYQENVWAESLARRGDSVCVFTVGARNTPAATVHEGGATYAVARVATLGWRDRHVYRTRRLGDALVGFRPDLVLWFGVPMGFGRDLCRDPRLAGVPVIAFFSLNSGMHPFDWRTATTARGRAHALAFRALRARDVVAGCQRADLIVGVTPETRDILRLYPAARDWPAIDAKIRTVPLGYDAGTFGYRPELVEPHDDVVIVTSSRFAPEKVPAIEACLTGIEAALAQRPATRALVVGVDDGPVSRSFAARLARWGGRLEPVPFSDRAGLARTFHRADIALYTRPTISCQEAMGTGCYAVFSRARAIGHLVRSPVRGVCFDPSDPGDMARTLVAAVDHLAAQRDRAGLRARIAAENADLAYDALIDGVLAGLSV